MISTSIHDKENENQNTVPTPYDDTFRTLMNDCVRLLIPVINEVFGKNYSGDEQIIFRPNEHFINQQDGKEQKRITDSSFSIISHDNLEEKFILECQSTDDDTLLIRIFEYITQEALDSGTITKYKLIVTIPNAAVLFLRSKKSTPNSMNIVINTPGGSVSFNVPVMKVQSYSLEQIFDKNLLFLLPFYIFNLEKNFPQYEASEEALKSLKKVYVDFMDRLEREVTEGHISAYYRRTILDMSKKVLENIAAKYKNVQKGVNDIMGGKVLEHEGKTILNEGIAIGEALGEERGRREEKFDTARRLRNAGMSDTQIHQFTDLPLDDLRLI
ncbi:MAG: hypothetical protein IJQ24_07940 [Synergistaceae bacterium]|nr:hypothetical protein [Synergistaceae bacterium]